jgi:hypothetical protein
VHTTSLLTDHKEDVKKVCFWSIKTVCGLYKYWWLWNYVQCSESLNCLWLTHTLGTLLIFPFNEILWSLRVPWLVQGCMAYTDKLDIARIVWLGKYADCSYSCLFPAEHFIFSESESANSVTHHWRCPNVWIRSCHMVAFRNSLGSCEKLFS